MIIGNEETADLIALIQHETMRTKTLMTYSIAVTAGGNSGIRLLLLLLILLGTGSASPASEGGQWMADPLSNLGAENPHAG